MKNHTYQLLTRLLRLTKGMVSAMEEWVHVEWQDSRPKPVASSTNQKSEG